MKTEDRSSAMQYANALLQLTEEGGDAKTMFTNLQTMRQVLVESPDLMVLFKHPSISAPDKIRVLKEATSGMDELTTRLLQLLCERRKLHLLPAIVEQYYELLRAKRNIVAGTLSSAEGISEDAVNRIKQRLEERLNKKVDLKTVVDKSLIGGYVLKIGDEVIDGSLKGRLHAIEKTLLSV